ncbi:PREDICTED: uncharacterized protein LOC109591696 [Amphimedon queenslandica]|uniref:Uncharacterized protein n=2 Tax=Amphimedon queenslandica TaxID=400682 RepID=A0AAN0K185_AMPQE|nr:PREDICTED: uncharacterized protein LOC109591696 [Amphimedon queenslandica]|eukprot:XP_019862929.1 PREDICTED: uncharacterized protein LOC109591696 [Amphimedon queenslandica]
MMYNVLKVIRQKPPPLDDLKELLRLYISRGLESKLDSCSDVSGVFRVIMGECSLTNISLLEAVVEEFKVTEAEGYIKNFRTTLTESCKSLSVSFGLKERLSHHLQCETITFVLDWEPEEHVLQDIKDILAKITGKLIVIKYIEPSV